MCKQIILLKTYKQPNVDDMELKLDENNAVVLQFEVEFEVESDWLEQTLKEWAWGGLNEFIHNYTYDDAEMVFNHYQKHNYELHLDCSNCFSENVERISENYRDGHGLYARVKCNDCDKFSEVGDGDYFKEVAPDDKNKTDNPVMVELVTYPQPNYEGEIMQDLENKPALKFKVEAEWLKDTLKSFKWGTIDDFLGDYTYDDSEMVFNHYRKYKGVYTVHCPLCSTGDQKTKMEYRTVNDTHAWVCPECPGIMFEFYFVQNINDLRELIK